VTTPDSTACMHGCSRQSAQVLLAGPGTRARPPHCSAGLFSYSLWYHIVRLVKANNRSPQQFPTVPPNNQYVILAARCSGQESYEKMELLEFVEDVQPRNRRSVCSAGQTLEPKCKPCDAKGAVPETLLTRCACRPETAPTILSN
jgi:hypothetical protein